MNKFVTSLYDVNFVQFSAVNENINLLVFFDERKLVVEVNFLSPGTF